LTKIRLTTIDKDNDVVKCKQSKDAETGDDFARLYPLEGVVVNEVV